MDKIEINVGNTLEVAEQLKLIKKSIFNISKEYDDLKKGVDSKITARNGLDAQLAIISDELRELDEKISQVTSIIQFGAELYEETEKKLVASNSLLFEANKKL